MGVYGLTCLGWKLVVVVVVVLVLSVPDRTQKRTERCEWFMCGCVGFCMVLMYGGIAWSCIVCSA
ncbi:uncharacterized protein F4807DRAFT_423357 [Annulohypoxylon truncatum]|uniref:uncharacterized protein n=1 Tax=Annulohypoxylon truncatum TaxID=327061 RepID=UPI002008CD87|nr:uncharacterized protein F4807DRAFT_423357 [Annulohypoxylon truncatum]KAI1210419.1 hypothetical protein F4807DRAFT_423357 [Annulohypoxylon truncatum]